MPVSVLSPGHILCYPLQLLLKITLGQKSHNGIVIFIYSPNENIRFLLLKISENIMKKLSPLAKGRVSIKIVFIFGRLLADCLTHGDILYFIGAIFRHKWGKKGEWSVYKCKRDAYSSFFFFLAMGESVYIGWYHGVRAFTSKWQHFLHIAGEISIWSLNLNKIKLIMLKWWR